MGGGIGEQLGYLNAIGLAGTRRGVPWVLRASLR
jgi:hypothetical protein